MRSPGGHHEWLPVSRVQKLFLERVFMIRLEVVSSELVRKLQQASAAKQRAAAVAAATFAVSKVNVDNRLVAEALAALQMRKMSLEQRANLDGLVAQLDDEYLDLQEAAEEGKAAPNEHLRPFGQARAIAAVSFAGLDDPYEAATEAIYEATATTDDPGEVLSLVHAML